MDTISQNAVFSAIQRARGDANSSFVSNNLEEEKNDEDIGLEDEDNDEEEDYDDDENEEDRCLTATPLTPISATHLPDRMNLIFLNSSNDTNIIERLKNEMIDFLKFSKYNLNLCNRNINTNIEQFLKKINFYNDFNYLTLNIFVKTLCFNMLYFTLTVMLINWY